jgi:hypothetical protein
MRGSKSKKQLSVATLISAATDTVAAKIRRNRVTGSFLTMGEVDLGYRGAG